MTFLFEENLNILHFYRKKSEIFHIHLKVAYP